MMQRLQAPGTLSSWRPTARSLTRLRASSRPCSRLRRGRPCAEQMGKKAEPPTSMSAWKPPPTRSPAPAAHHARFAMATSTASPGLRPMRSATRKGIYYSRNASDFIEASLVSRALRFALSERQLADHGFSPAQAKTLLGPVALDSVHIDRQGANKSNGLGAFFLPFFCCLAIYMTVLIYGLYVMRSVIEEKTSRVVEVLLSQRHPDATDGRQNHRRRSRRSDPDWHLGRRRRSSARGSFAMAHQIIGDSMKDAHISTAVLHPVSGVFHPWLRHLRLPVCRHRSHGQQRRRGAAVAVPGHSAADPVHGVCQLPSFAIPTLRLPSGSRCSR